ncbi:class I SAM-dependent methyltransferase [Bifidobacterium tsurumiense]|uniref:Type 12 methyltransferase n=1 Tax=Bifidobacterium tsurumiense TaxID=356829 RepID=A0A087EEE4_9BIFI|nr:class I SAM-dependent methyltransferase [Bifidobacterium tsurumiense]KFJ06145.1 type 12 methyltransferase [Bifidobacterium tsurumiense]
MTTASSDQYFKDNEANWDDRAQAHMSGDYGGVNELLADPQAISMQLAQDIERFGDLRGKDVLHLQCHVGVDTIGFARRGAHRVVGLDLSEKSLEYARYIATRAQEDIEFIHANVYEARQAVDGEFDLVYTSLGVLCWLPDIAGWAKVVASLMKRGSTFFIRDDHPMMMTIDDDVSNGLKVAYPYFQTESPLTWDDEESYVSYADSPKIKHTRNHQWNHSLGEIVSALIQAGLTIDDLEESTYSAWCPWPDLMEEVGSGRYRLKEGQNHIPLQFAIAAHK